jgi:hypothetical protein
LLLQDYITLKQRKELSAGYYSVANGTDLAMITSESGLAHRTELESLLKAQVNLVAVWERQWTMLFCE